MILTTVGWTLVHFIWQGALIALALGIVRRGFRHASPEARYGIACAALFAIAIVPLVTAISVSAGATRLDTPILPTSAAPSHPQSLSIDWIVTRVPLVWGLGVGLLTGVLRRGGVGRRCCAMAARSIVAMVRTARQAMIRCGFMIRFSSWCPPDSARGGFCGTGCPGISV